MNLPETAYGHLPNLCPMPTPEAPDHTLRTAAVSAVLVGLTWAAGWLALAPASILG